MENKIVFHLFSFTIQDSQTMIRMMIIKEVLEDYKIVHFRAMPLAPITLTDLVIPCLRCLYVLYKY